MEQRSLQETRPWRRKLLFAAPLIVLLALGAWLVQPFWKLSGQLDRGSSPQPSRLYGLPFTLTVGDALSADDVIAELQELGYRATNQDRFGIGRYRQAGDALGVHLRAHATPAGWQKATPLRIRFRGRTVAGLEVAGQAVRSASLEPPLLTSFQGPQQEERRPASLAEMPEALVQSVLAVEDDSFFSHQGLSISGILRAAWVNLRGGTVRQGGSTLTQQLVKNLFLSHDRTLSRKAQEALLAILVELRWDKETILEAYLNEIYLGRRGGMNLMGMGAAAHAFFGKSAAELDLSEAATLAGMIRAPAIYDPTEHPERARQRRDQVLDRLEALAWVPVERIAEAREEEISVAPPPRRSRQASYFADLVAAEARERFGIESLDDRGYHLLSTLEVEGQAKAEEAVAWGIDALEKGWQKNHKGGEALQAALVSIDPEDGGIRAYVGGRDYGTSQFDRASQARRQAGSAFKPVIYAAAFDARAASPSTLVDDSPLTVRQAGRSWSPSNDDRTFDGWMTVRTAVERSRNVPTVRLALQVGLERIVKMARGMGISTRLEPLPSIALGAFEVTPLEMASVYGTLAALGERPPVHGLRAVLSPGGEPLDGLPPPQPERILSPQSAYLLTSVLEGVFERGTAQRARQDGLDEPLAGKTGTSNDRRDSWFAGYSSRRATVVWVGYDSNAATRLSGARAALPIWSRFMHGVRPPGGYRATVPPEGVLTATVDPETGELATGSCPVTVQEVFLAGQEPTATCHLHGSFRDRFGRPPRDDRRHPFREWLDRVFRGRRQGATAPL